MAKLQEKHAAVLEHLHKLVSKEAATPATETEKVANPTASGVPGADTNYQSISDKHEQHDKNSIGADKLTPQAEQQHAATEPSAPVAKAADEKSAETEKSATEIGKEVLAMIEQYKEAAAKGKPAATGVPTADTNVQAVSDKAENHNKNEIGADKLTPQNHEQHASTEPSKPAATAKKADVVNSEDVNKVASFEFGRTLAEMFIKSAHENEVAMLKEAGRRDFELMIAQAAAELEKEQTGNEKTASNQSMSKEAAEEAAGAQAFHDLMKQAQLEQAFTEMQKKAEAAEARAVEAEKKASQYAEREAVMAKQAAEQAEMAKFAAMADYIKNEVLSALKQEVLKNA